MMSVVEFFSQPVWYRLSLTLVHFLWQGLAVAVIAYAAVRVLRLKRGNPRYAAYLIAFALMAICPLITFAVLGGPTRPAAIGPAPTPEVASPGPAPRSVGPEPPQPLNEDPVTVSPTHRAPLRERLDGMAQAALPWALACWMGGVVVLSVRLLLGFIGVRRWRRGLEPLPRELAARVHILSERLGLPGFSRVFLSCRAMEAVALGYLRPTVLLPAAIVTHMPPEMLEAVIAHELAHIRRFDLWVNLAQRVIETLLFYHPAVWWLSNRLRAERELCCDELAVRATGERLTYASALESAGRVRLGIRQPALAVALGQDRKSTLSRVRHILGLPPAPSDSRFWLAGVIAVILLALLAMPAVPALTASAATQTASESRQAPEPAKSIHQAAADGDIDEVKRLIAAGADVNARDAWDDTPLHRAAAAGQKESVELLLARGAKVNAEGESGKTPLHDAARKGHEEVVGVLIAGGADLNARDGSGRQTPLIQAVQKDHRKVVELLVTKGADVNAMDKYGLGPLRYAERQGRAEIVDLLRKYGATQYLHYALLAGDIEKVEELIAQHASVNLRDVYGRTPLHVAVQIGRSDMAELLISKGADINAKAESSQTPLHYACGSDNKDMVELLLSRGADVHARDRYGRTLLHIAAQMGHRDVAELLINKGTDINAKAESNQTPLHYACGSDNKDMVELLLSRGADVHARTQYDSAPIHYAAGLGSSDVVERLLAAGADLNATTGGRTPLYVAICANRSKTVELLTAKGAKISPIHLAAFLGNAATVKTLIEGGADANARDGAGFTPLHNAVCGDRKDVVTLLIEHGADINATGWRQWTPLHHASDIGPTDMVELLINHGAKVDLRGENGNTPLLLAAGGGHVDVIRRLLAEGADVNTRGDRESTPGSTPLHIASGKGHKAVVELLLTNGADINAKTDEGHTPLSVARDKGRAEIVELLRRHGAKE